MALKILELTKKEQEAILKDKNLVLCPNCSNIVLKTDCYCGLHDFSLRCITEFIASLKKM